MSAVKHSKNCNAVFTEWFTLRTNMAAKLSASLSRFQDMRAQGRITSSIMNIPNKLEEGVEIENKNNVKAGNVFSKLFCCRLPATLIFLLICARESF